MSVCAAVLAAFCVSSSAVWAGDEAKEKVKPASTVPAQEKARKADKVIITGSNIPQKISKLDRTPLTASPVVIIDRQAIDRTGATTVAGVLSKQSTFWH